MPISDHPRVHRLFSCRPTTSHDTAPSASASASESDLVTGSGKADHAPASSESTALAPPSDGEKGGSTACDGLAEDARWAPEAARGGVLHAASTQSQPSDSLMQVGCELTGATHEAPESSSPPPVFLPTQAALLAAAIFMFCSGTGAVVALGPDPAVKEATLDLLMRIRAAIKDLFNDVDLHAKLPPSGDAILDMEEAGGYLAAAVLGAGLLPSGDAARAVGEVVRAKADGAKGTAKKPGLLVMEPKRLALQAGRDAKKAGLDEAATQAAVEAARVAARTAVLSEVIDLKLKRERVIARPCSPDRLEVWCSRRKTHPRGFGEPPPAYGVGGVLYRQALRAAESKWLEASWKPSLKRAHFDSEAARLREACVCCEREGPWEPTCEHKERPNVPSWLWPVVTCYAGEVGTCMEFKAEPPSSLGILANSRRGAILCDCLSWGHRKSGDHSISRSGEFDGDRWPTSYERCHGVRNWEGTDTVPWTEYFKDANGVRCFVNAMLHETSGMVSGNPPPGKKRERWEVSEWTTTRLGLPYGRPSAMKLVGQWEVKGSKDNGRIVRSD